MSEFNKTYLSVEQMKDGLWPSHMLDDVFLIPSDLTNEKESEDKNDSGRSYSGFKDSEPESEDPVLE